MANPTSDVIVVGAGVVGLSVARVLAARGRRVLVIERQRVGAEASSAAAGILSAEAHVDADSPLLPLARMARQRHARLAPEPEAEAGVAVERSSRGLLDLELTEEDESGIERKFVV